MNLFKKLLVLTGCGFKEIHGPAKKGEQAEERRRYRQVWQHI